MWLRGEGVGATHMYASAYPFERLLRRRRLYFSGRTPLGVSFKNQDTLSCATLGGTRFVGVNPEPPIRKILVELSRY